MKTVFADTGYWIAIVNPRDELHQKAKEITTSLAPLQIVTSEIVFGELLTGFSNKGEPLRRVAVQLIDRALNEQNIEVIPQTPELFIAALTLYKNRLDKNWSYADCASFCIMEQQNIREALTHDHHFEQAGFIALLRR